MNEFRQFVAQTGYPLASANKYNVPEFNLQARCQRDQQPKPDQRSSRLSLTVRARP
jgi:hypothetical protein